jgi:formate-dependent nitrite reductase membrane component NrfD
MKNNKKQGETEHKSRWSIISNVAVIISLILVIFELRQNHKALEEANTIARMESANDA